MKKIAYIILLSLCSLLRADDFSTLKKLIAANDATLVYTYLKTAFLTSDENQQLLAYARQNTMGKKIKMENFSHHVGLKRQAVGVLSIAYALLSTYNYHDLPVIDIIIGIGFYQWGKNAEHDATIKGKIETTKNYDAALAIEQLIALQSLHK
jgi:hypothetical protein